MRGLAFLAAAALAGGCATSGPAGPPGGGVLRAAELASVRCLLVAPFENASDLARAGEVATLAVVSGVDQGRVRLMPVTELRGVFRDTPVELPVGIPPSAAMELADILGADAAIYGAVEGRVAEVQSTLFLTLRLASAARREVLYAATVPVVPSPLETAEAALQRTVAEAGHTLFTRLGSPPAPRGCFDPARIARVRALAAGRPEPRLARAAPPPAPAPPPSAAPTPPPPAPPPARAATAAPAPARRPARTVSPRNPRQADWARRLEAGERFLLDGLSFQKRTGAIDRDGALADLAGALAAAPSASVRLEGFVDATADVRGDLEISSAMARAAADRLVRLGVRRDRVSWAGRGGERPLLPNFTARGRAANRRVEVVVVP